MTGPMLDRLMGGLMLLTKAVEESNNHRAEANRIAQERNAIERARVENLNSLDLTLERGLGRIADETRNAATGVTNELHDLREAVGQS